MRLPRSGPPRGSSLPGKSARSLRRSSHLITVLQLENGKIVKELGLDDGVTALTQLGQIKTIG